MIQGAGGASLPLESLQPFRVVRENRRKNLDRHVPMQSRVSRPVDLSHPACANYAENLIGTEPVAGAQHP